MWDVGLREYITDMWNVVDFVTNALYVATIALRLVAYYRVCDSTDYPVHLVDSLLLLLLHVVVVLVTGICWEKKIGYSVSNTRSNVLIDNYYTISQVYFWVGRKFDLFCFCSDSNSNYTGLAEIHGLHIKKYQTHFTHFSILQFHFNLVLKLTLKLL